jgi:hypothetical protein
VIRKTLTHLCGQALMLLICLGGLLLTGCAATRVEYVQIPCQPPASLLKQPESPLLLRQLRELLTPVPGTQTDSKTPLTGPRS